MPVVPGALMATAALNVPALPSAEGFTVTWNEPGTDPKTGLTVSQFPPLAVVPAAVNVATLELLLETPTPCVAATVLFGGNVKLNEFGVAVRGLVPPELAFKVTGMLRAPAEEVALIKATLVPDVGAFEPIETVNESGVVPLLGVTTSQLAEAGVIEEAIVTLTGVLDVSRTGWEGVVTPDCVLNVSCVGLAVRPCARAVSKQPSASRRRMPIEDSDLRVFVTIGSSKEIWFGRRKARVDTV